MFNKYVRVVVGRLTSFVDEKVFNETFNENQLNVIEEMTEWSKTAKRQGHNSRVFRVEYDSEKGFEVFDDDNNRLEFDY